MFFQQGMSPEQGGRGSYFEYFAMRRGTSGHKSEGPSLRCPAPDPLRELKTLRILWSEREDSFSPHAYRPSMRFVITQSVILITATGGTVDATQEMISLAFCNILASFCSSMPICGAFTRSAVSNASGVRTPFANFYTGSHLEISLD